MENPTGTGSAAAAEAVVYLIEGEMVRMGVPRGSRVTGTTLIGDVLDVKVGGAGDAITVDLGRGTAKACASAFSQLEALKGRRACR